MEHLKYFNDYINRLNIYERNKLLEYFKLNEDGLIRSVDYDIFIKHITNYLSKFNFHYELETLDVGITLFIKVEYLLNIKNDLYKLINNLGYYKSQYIIFNKNRKIILDGTFDLRFDNIINENSENYISVFCNKKYDFEFNENVDLVYHITTLDILENKILKYGLIPKYKNLDILYPDRIYLFIKENFNLFTDFIINKYNELKKIVKDKSEYYDIENFVILKINLKSIDKIKIMEDPYYLPEKCYYTTDNIPKYAIVDIEHVNVNSIIK